MNFQNVFDKPTLCGSDCVPWNHKLWETPVVVPPNMDPALFNVLNGCWMCNFEKQDLENNYLCSRNFDIDPRVPCNKLGPSPINSADEICRSRKS
jgi:hypothetical protein